MASSYKSPRLISWVYQICFAAMADIRAKEAKEGCAFMKGETVRLQACRQWWQLLEYAVRRDIEGAEGEVYGDGKGKDVVKLKTCNKAIADLDQLIKVSK